MRGILLVVVLALPHRNASAAEPSPMESPMEGRSSTPEFLRLQLAAPGSTPLGVLGDYLEVLPGAAGSHGAARKMIGRLSSLGFSDSAEARAVIAKLGEKAWRGPGTLVKLRVYIAERTAQGASPQEVDSLENLAEAVAYLAAPGGDSTQLKNGGPGLSKEFAARERKAREMVAAMIAYANGSAQAASGAEPIEAADRATIIMTRHLPHIPADSPADEQLRAQARLAYSSLLERAGRRDPLAEAAQAAAPPDAARLLLENRRRRLAEQWGVDYEQFSQPHHLMVAHAAGLYYKLLGDYTLLNPRDPSSETLSLFDIIERPVFNFISPTGKPAPVEPWQPPPLVYEKTESNSVVGNQDVFLTPDMEQGDRLRMRVLLDLEEAWPCVVFEFLNKETMWAKITVEDACDYWNKQRKFEVMGGQGLPASNLGAELRNAEGRFSLSDFFTRQDLYLWPNTIGAPFPLWPDFKDFALHLVTQYDPSGLKVFETFTSGLGIAFELLITKNRDDGLLEIQFVRQEDNGRLTRRIYLKEKQ